jgi:hypothetical protein
MGDPKFQNVSSMNPYGSQFSSYSGYPQPQHVPQISGHYSNQYQRQGPSDLDNYSNHGLLLENEMPGPYPPRERESLENYGYGMPEPTRYHNRAPQHFPEDPRFHQLPPQREPFYGLPPAGRKGPQNNSMLYSGL